MVKVKTEFRRIGYSFARAFFAGITVTQIADIQDTRGWKGMLTSALLAAIAAALRTAEAALRADASDPDPDM